MVLRIAITQPAASADVRRNGRAVRELMRQAVRRPGREARALSGGHLSGYVKEQVGALDQVDWDASRDQLRQVIHSAV